MKKKQLLSLSTVLILGLSIILFVVSEFNTVKAEAESLYLKTHINKVKIIIAPISRLEKEVNDFIKDKNVVDIEYGGDIYSVLIHYTDME